MQSNCQAQRVMLAAQQKCLWESKQRCLIWLGKNPVFVCSSFLMQASEDSNQPVNCSPHTYFSHMWRIRHTSGRVEAGREDCFGVPSRLPPHSQTLVENRALTCWRVRPITDLNHAVTSQSSAARWPLRRKPDSVLFDREWTLGLPAWLEMISELRKTWGYKQKQPIYVMLWSLGLPPWSDSDASVSVVGIAQCYTCIKGSPQHVQSVRKAPMPSVHLSKDIHTGHQAKHFTQGSGSGPMGARADGENQK